MTSYFSIVAEKGISEEIAAKSIVLIDKRGEKESNTRIVIHNADIAFTRDSCNAL